MTTTDETPEDFYTIGYVDAVMSDGKGWTVRVGRCGYFTVLAQPHRPSKLDDLTGHKLLVINRGTGLLDVIDA